LFTFDYCSFQSYVAALSESFTLKFRLVKSLLFTLPQRVQIQAGEAGSLPEAHTCFNMLVLPICRSLPELENRLRIALTEGLEGFELA